MAAICTFKSMFSALEKVSALSWMNGKEFDRKIGGKNYFNTPSVKFMLWRDLYHFLLSTTFSVFLILFSNSKHIKIKTQVEYILNI